VINLSCEYNTWTLERVVYWKLNLELEDATRIRAVCRSHDNTLPAIQIITLWPSGTVCGRISTKVL
jgi:hypothetical protein